MLKMWLKHYRGTSAQLRGLKSWVKLGPWLICGSFSHQEVCNEPTSVLQSGDDFTDCWVGLKVFYLWRLQVLIVFELESATSMGVLCPSPFSLECWVRVNKLHFVHQKVTDTHLFTLLHFWQGLDPGTKWLPCLWGTLHALGARGVLNYIYVLLSIVSLLFRS